MLYAEPYAYAKTCGIISKSNIGKRLCTLRGLKTLDELDARVFFKRYGQRPSGESLSDLVNRISARSSGRIKAIVSSFSKPPELFERMLSAYEYEDLKKRLQLISGGEKEAPSPRDIGRFKTVNFHAYPDIAKMIKGSRFESLLGGDLKSIERGGADIKKIETTLDDFYYRSVIKSLPEIKGEDRAIIERYLYDEISLRNCLWASRLRSYYKLSDSQIKEHLLDIDFDSGNGKRFSSADDAVKSLDFPLDSRAAWNGWKRESFLNHEDANYHWTVDARHFQNAAFFYLYKKAIKGFYRSPLSIRAIFYFIKLERFEEDILTSVAEGLALGMSSDSVFELLEVPL